MNPRLKEHIFSAVLTFLTGFLLMASQEVTSLTMESLKDGTLVGVLLVSLRTGLKLATEYFVTEYAKR